MLSEEDTTAPAEQPEDTKPAAETHPVAGGKLQGENLDQLSGSTDLSPLQAAVDRIRAEVGKIIVGQRKMLDQMIAALLADGHILIEGVPGVAKTLTAKLLARAVSVGFSRIQFTPDLMPADVIGTNVFDPKTQSFDFHKGPVFANMVLIDEINRSPAKTQAALFEVMEERQITVDGTRYPLPPPFMVMATQNPVEHEGTYRLPEAQLDRFLFLVEVGYPSQEEEAEILHGFNNRDGKQGLNSVTSVLEQEDLLKYREEVRKIRIEKQLIDYISRLVHQTRNDPALFLGASPRASLAIMHGAKAYAAMDGRDFVTPEDIRMVTFPVLKHRIILTPEQEMEGVSTHQVIERLVENLEVPR